MASPVAPVPPVVPVLYDDEWYVVVDKPSGLCVHDSPEVSSDDTDFVIDRAAGIATRTETHCAKTTWSCEP